VSGTVGQAALTDERAAQADHYAAQAALANQAVLLSLLTEVRGRFGATDPLGIRIDGVVHQCAPQGPGVLLCTHDGHSTGDCGPLCECTDQIAKGIYNRLPDCVYCGFNSHWSRVCPAMPDSDRRPRVGQVTTSESPWALQPVGGGTEEPETEPLVPFSSPRDTNLTSYNACRDHYGDWHVRCLRCNPPSAPVTDVDLVYERLPSGEFAWLKADLTDPDRSPQRLGGGS
jgi:hypothetical protein